MKKKWLDRMRARRAIFFALITFLVAGCAKPAFEIASVRAIGNVSAPGTVLARDGGASALIGGKILWTFGDTLLARPAVDGASLRSNTAAFADPASPLAVSETLDANGAPRQFIPFTPEEQSYNDATRNPNDRIALWPLSVVASDNGGGIIFYLKLRVRGALQYEFIGTGIARVAANSFSASRDPELLFAPPDPLFGNAIVFDREVYVYGALSDGSQNVAVARAPLERIGERGAYRFWNGSAWVSDVRDARAVIQKIPGAVSVSFNPYLQQYLAVHSELLSNKIVIQRADHPEGAWSDPVIAFSGIATSPGRVDYAGIEHPELMQNNGRTIFASYYHPQDIFRGELRLVEINFK